MLKNSVKNFESSAVVLIKKNIHIKKKLQNLGCGLQKNCYFCQAIRSNKQIAVFYKIPPTRGGVFICRLLTYPSDESSSVILTVI